MATISGVVHFGMVVRDMDKSIAFYRECLGMEIVLAPTEIAPGDDVDRAIGAKGIHGRMAVLQLKNDLVEMLEFDHSAHTDCAEFPAPDVLGVMHLALQTDDIAGTKKTLEANGVRFLSEPMPGANGSQWVFFEDPDGIRIELIQAKNEE